MRCRRCRRPTRPSAGCSPRPLASLARIYRSPGPINDPQGTGADFSRLGTALEAAGFGPGDVVLNSFSYHLTPGGLMLDGGLRAVGCVVIPGGSSAIAAQTEAAHAAGATAYTGIPQVLLTLLERAEESGQPLGFERALVTGAALPPSLRTRLQDGFGVDVYQAYAAADTGLIGYECPEKDGWHVAPEVVVEVLRPGDDRPAAEGRRGRWWSPARTRSTRWCASARGTSPPGIARPVPAAAPVPAWWASWAGWARGEVRGVKVRPHRGGMFVHPRELAAALGPDPTVGRYQAVVSAEGARDVFTVRVETAPRWTRRTAWWTLRPATGRVASRAHPGGR